MTESNQLYRHGDVLLMRINESIPKDAKKVNGSILVRGEVTGHAHRLETPGAFQIYETPDSLLVEVKRPTKLIHEDHDPITLEEGLYKVWVQREYTPQTIRRVID